MNNLRKFTHILSLLAILLTALPSCKTGKTDPPKNKGGRYDFKQVFHQAMQEKMRNNYDVAAENFLKCLGMEPENDAVHFALSDCYEALGETEKALQYAVKAHELDRENKWYQLRCADLYFAKGNYHKSAEYYGYSIASEKNIEIKFKYAESLIFSQQYKKAIVILDEIEVETSIAPHLSLTKHDLYLELGDENGAEAELKKLVESDPGNTENQIVVADYFLRTNQMPKAEKIANEALNLAPNNGELRLILADIAIRKGDLKTCFEHLEIGFNSADVSLTQKIGLIGNLQQYAFEDSEDGRMIKSGLEKLYVIIYSDEIGNDTLHAQYGYFLDGINKPLEAIEQFKKGVGINPASFDNWMTLIYAQMEVKDYAGMLESSKKAVDLFPAQPTIFLLAAIAALENKMYDQAEEWLYYGKGLVVRNPGLEAEFQHQLGVLSWKQKDYDQAHMYFDEAKRIDNFNGNVYESKALCFMDEGKKDEALGEVQSAIDQVPTNAYFLNLKATIHARRGEPDDALRSVESALIFEPKNPLILENYGDILFRKGQIDKAVEQWQKALDNGGYSPLLIKKLNDKTYYEQ